MPALVAGIHALERGEGVDGRDKPGHDAHYFMLGEQRHAVGERKQIDAGFALRSVRGAFRRLSRRLL
jgi:hypothetical protein